MRFYQLFQSVAYRHFLRGGDENPDQAPSLAPQGAVGRDRLLETLAYISTEIHKGFKPFFAPGSTDAQKAKAAETITQRLGLLATQVKDGFIFGTEVSVADAHLFVMLIWAKKYAVEVPIPCPHSSNGCGRGPP